MLFVSDERVRAFNLTPGTIMPVAEQVLSAMACDDIVTVPRPTIETRQGVRFMAFPVVIERLGIAGVKWLGTTPGPALNGRGGSLIILSDAVSAKPFAVVDGAWITAVRTAAVSLLAARAMASPDSSRIAFIACGEQARIHLEFFAEFFHLRSVSAYSRSLETASRFAEFAKQKLGCDARAFSSVQRCVEDADIVISSTPNPAGEHLQPQWLKETCFLSLVDLARSFDTQGLPPGAALIVDDLNQFGSLAGNGKIPAFGPIDLVPLMAALQGSRHLGKPGGFFFPTGLGAIDIWLAYDVYKSTATERS